jgi:hypothetical protein
MTFWKRANRFVAPTEGAATALLWLLAALAILVALFGSPLVKGFVAGWMVLP